MSMTAATIPEVTSTSDEIQEVTASREDIFGEATMRLNEFILRGRKTLPPGDVVSFVDNLMLDFKLKLEDMPRFCSWYREEATRRQGHHKERNIYFVAQHIINSIDHCRELGDWQMDR